MAHYIYIACPLCGRNRVRELTSEKAAAKGKLGLIRWDFVDIKNDRVIQIREQHCREPGGKCKGFTLIDSMSLKEAMNDPKFVEDLERMKRQLLRIIKDSIKIGFIRKEEL